MSSFEQVYLQMLRNQVYNVLGTLLKKHLLVLLVGNSHYKRPTTHSPTSSAVNRMFIASNNSAKYLLYAKGKQF